MIWQEGGVEHSRWTGHILEHRQMGHISRHGVREEHGLSTEYRAVQHS